MAKSPTKPIIRRTKWIIVHKVQVMINVFGPWWLWPLAVHEASEDKKNRLWRVQVLCFAAELRRTATEVDVEVVTP